VTQENREIPRPLVVNLKTPDSTPNPSALVKIPNRFLNMLTQQAPLVGGHHCVSRRPLGRLRVDLLRGLHGRHLMIAIAAGRLLAHSMLSAHEPSIERMGF
jgi:hypothetical protein